MYVMSTFLYCKYKSYLQRDPTALFRRGLISSKRLDRRVAVISRRVIGRVRRAGRRQMHERLAYLRQGHHHRGVGVGGQARVGIRHGRLAAGLTLGLRRLLWWLRHRLRAVAAVTRQTRRPVETGQAVDDVRGRVGA